jgi:hypothetical protein
MKASTWLSILTAALVIFLAISAFVLSYDALRSLSAANGFDGWRSYLWPLTLDAVMIVSVLTVIRANVVRERAWLPWCMVLGFTIASIAYNILHASPDLLARSIASLPPLVVFLSLEMLSGQLRSAVRKADKEFRKSQKEVSTEDKTGFPMAIEQARERRALGKQAAIDTMLDFFADHPNASHSEAASVCNRSRSWVTNAIGDLERNGVIKRDGKGVEIVRR